MPLKGVLPLFHERRRANAEVENNGASSTRGIVIDLGTGSECMLGGALLRSGAPDVDQVGAPREVVRAFLAVADGVGRCEVGAPQAPRPRKARKPRIMVRLE